VIPRYHRSYRFLETSHGTKPPSRPCVQTPLIAG
jgi:hypothetical protein